MAAHLLNSDGVVPGSKLLMPQRMGYVGIVLYIMLSQTVCLFATDLFMPALPQMRDYFGQPAEVMNIILLVFFVFYPIGILLCGTLSDKYGRKPVMLIFTVIYTLSSLMCAASFAIGMLIIARVFQAFSAGAIIAVSMAIIKDCFAEKFRENVFLFVQVAITIGPIVAPLVGGRVILVFPWQANFLILAVIGLICVLMTVCYQESLPSDNRTKGTAFKSLGRLGVVSRNKGFMIYLFTIAVLICMPFFPYISLSSYIYIDFFALTAQEYSYFFAATTASWIISILIYKLLSKWVSHKAMTTGLIVLAAIAGICIIAFGSYSPFLFAAFIVVFYICNAIARPFSTNILMNNIEGDTGSASSIINFAQNGVGCIGMLFIMLPLGSNFLRLGLLIVISCLISALLWIIFRRAKIPFVGLE